MSKGTSAFDNTWKKIILPSITKCREELDKDFAREAEACVVDLVEYKDKLEYIYKRKREWLKAEYLPNEENPILDFHKLSSIMCRCIVGIKPFSYNIDVAERFFSRIADNEEIEQCEKVAWQIDNVYVNYKLAFVVAEGMNFIDLLYWAQEKINQIKEQYSEEQIESNEENVSKKIDVYNEFIELLNEKQQRLYSYKTSESHDNFFTSAIIALMKNDYLKRDFDYLQFSLSMFQWQEYTKKQHLYDLLNSKQNNQLELSDLI